MKRLKCRKCGELDCIVSIEEITEMFTIYVNDDGTMNFESFNGKTLYSEVASIQCRNCEEHYGTSLDDVEDLIIDWTGEEE